MLILSILLLLFSNAVTLRRDKSILFSRVTILILLYSAFITNNSYHINFTSDGIGIYGGLFHVTNITQIFHIFIFLIGAVILQLTAFYPRKIWSNKFSTLKMLMYYNLNYYKEKITDYRGEQFRIIEYPLIILFIISGSAFLISTNDLISIFLSIELQSYGLYLLSTLYRNSELATSAGLTYFLLGGLSSCFILLGTALLYSNSGITNLDSLYVIANLTDVINEDNIAYFYKNSYIHISLLILSVGFLFKISAAPFHFWSPDVYDAVPTIVTTFIAIIAKISILVFLLEIVHHTSNSSLIGDFSWVSIILISSLLSLVIGTVVGLTQFRIKKLLAYSTISHLGFILLALAVNTIESTQAFIFYLMQYSLSNLNVFLLLLSIGYLLYFYINNNKNNEELVDKINSPVQFISQIKGFFHINPFISISLAITIFSFVGIPPLIGFFAKQMVLSAALDNGYVFITLVAILTSVVSAVYYLNMIKQIFFDKPDYIVNPNLINTDMFYSLSENYKNKKTLGIFPFTISNIALSSYLTISISIITLITVLFVFIPQEWLSMANILALTLNNY